MVPTVARNPFAADLFLRFRYEDSTAAFSVMAALLLLLASYLVAVFVPSVLAELKFLRVKASDKAEAGSRLAADAARDLGRWLTAGYRHLGGTVSFVVAIAIVGALAVAVVLHAKPAEGAGAWNRAIEFAAYLSQVLLRPLVLGAASIAAALTPARRAALEVRAADRARRSTSRSTLTTTFANFRAPTSRGRASSRATPRCSAIWRCRGYERIVIVSHSQGTVISAELLRFLASDGRRTPVAGTPPRPDSTPAASRRSTC